MFQIDANIDPYQEEPVLGTPCGYLRDIDYAITRTACSCKDSPDMDKLAIGYLDGTIDVWESEGQQKYVSNITLKGHTDGVYFISWSPESDRIATASFDGTVVVWESATLGYNLTDIIQTSSSKVYDVSWSQSGVKPIMKSAQQKNFFLY